MSLEILWPQQFLNFMTTRVQINADSAREGGKIKIINHQTKLPNLTGQYSSLTINKISLHCLVQSIHIRFIISSHICIFYGPKVSKNSLSSLSKLKNYSLHTRSDDHRVGTPQQRHYKSGAIQSFTFLSAPAVANTIETPLPGKQICNQIVITYMKISSAKL